MLIYLLLLVFFYGTPSYVLAKWEAMNPEETLFAYTRCMEVGVEDVTTPDQRRTILEKWRAWNIATADEKTKCYVKCVLEGLQILEKGQFKPERVTIQHNTYKTITKADDKEVQSLRDKLKGIKTKSLSTCDEVYNAIKPVFGNLPIAKTIYHGDKELASKVYEDFIRKEKRIRGRNQTYFSYCERKYYPDPKDKKLCTIRKYTVGNDLVGDTFKKHIECIFKGVRYFDRKNKFNKTELVRDFVLANRKANVAALNMKLKSCSKETPISVYECLVKDSKDAVFHAFKDALDYREIRSGDYKYRLLNPVYNQADIRKKIADIDEKICSRG